MKNIRIRKVNFKKAPHTILSVLIVLYCFYSYGLQPYFTWKTYDIGLWGIINQLPIRAIISVGIIVLGLLFFFDKSKIDSKMILFAVWLFISSSLGIFLAGEQFIFSFEWLIPISTAIYVMLPRSIKVKSYIYFTNAFVVLLIVPIIIYFLVHIGISIPYTTIISPEDLKASSGIYYRIYPLASQWMGQWSTAYYSLRMCGIYNEPGVVGTFCALLLCGDNFRLKNNYKNIILLVGGILSFSLAFYAIILVYFFCKVASIKQKYALMIIIFILAYVVFLNIHFDNYAITRFQERLQFTSTGLSGNNRTNAAYDSIFNRFFEQDIITILLGKGNGAIEGIMVDQIVDGASYKNLIYDFGILGFLGQIVWLFGIVKIMCKNKNRNIKVFCFAMFFIYCANMYQRPSMYAIQYLIVFFGAIILSSEGKTRDCIRQGNFKFLLFSKKNS